MAEVGVRPMASRYVRFVPQAETAANSLPVCKIFRATLRNGQMFAIDPCNAQYNFSTSAEHGHGVSEWDSYIERLLIADRDTIDVKPTNFGHFLPAMITSGTLADAQAGNFLDADIKATAEMKAHSNLMTLGTIIGAQGVPFPLPGQPSLTTLPKLMSRSSTDHEHAKEVAGFKKQLQQMTELSQSLGTKEMLLNRLRHLSGN
jgi:hypothetical protein